MILVTLAAGFLIGRFRLIPERFMKYTQWVTTGGLIFLLASMGAGLSSNPDLLQKISQLGVQALVLAVVSIIGSVFFVWLVQKRYFSQVKGGRGQ